MGKLLVIKGANFAASAIGSESIEPTITLDTVAYAGLTYRYIFETKNAVSIYPGFEDGTAGSLTANSSGSPTPKITSEISDSGTYCAKVFGSTSTQYAVPPILGIPSGSRYFIACRAYCTRYSTGNLGIVLSTYGAALTTTNSGFETVVADVTTTSNSTLFVGSWSSANLDGYIDTPVAINTNIFANDIPSISTFENLYNNYVSIKKQA